MKKIKKFIFTYLINTDEKWINTHCFGRRWGVAIVATYAIWLCFAFFQQEHYLFFPSRMQSNAPGPSSLNMELSSFYTKDNVKLTGAFLKNEKSDEVILFFHENAGNITNYLGIFSFNAGFVSLPVFHITISGSFISPTIEAKSNRYLIKNRGTKYLKNQGIDVVISATGFSKINGIRGFSKAILVAKNAPNSFPQSVILSGEKPFSFCKKSTAALASNKKSFSFLNFHPTRSI